jgi:hypothetical protein
LASREGFRPAFDYVEGIPAGQWAAGHLPVTINRAEERAFLIGGDACRIDVGVKVILGVEVGGHRVPLATFLMRAEPCPSAFGKVIRFIRRKRTLG